MAYSDITVLTTICPKKNGLHESNINETQYLMDFKTEPFIFFYPFSYRNDTIFKSSQ